MNRRIDQTTVGLIGCGNWGSNILRDLIRLGCTVYVADTDARAGLRASEGGAAKVCSCSGELPPCDGYVVAVPIPDLTRECAGLLERRKPIFSEKTLCLSLDDFDLLHAMGGSQYIFAMHKWHYHPGIEALRLVALSGRLGAIEELHTIRHGWVKDFHGGDVFWTQAVHDLTIVKHILGHIPEDIRAINVITDDDGLAVSCTVMLGTKPAVVISVSGRHCNKASGVSIHGREGSAGLHDAYDNHITIRLAEGEENVPIDTSFPLYLELQEFVQYLHGGPQPRCNLNSAREITETILNLRSKAAL